jgi:glycosyltransferase involved in cell wall biosynthesis
MESSAKPTIAYLTAGGAGMFCGSCMHDNTLVAALAKLDCDPWLIPLYTPIRTDETDVSIDRVFFGGINVYLQQRWSIFRWLPSFLDSWLDAPWLLKRVATGNVAVDARELGDLTLSMLRGEHGHQRKEVRRLVGWLKKQVRPQLVVLSNVLIAGVIPTIKRELDVPVLGTLQGDDIFLDDLLPEFRQQAQTEIRKLAQSVDGFLTFSDYYSGHMSDYLAVPRDRFHRVPLGILMPPLQAPDLDRSRPPRVGYFARICPAKGFHVLVDAWMNMRRRPECPRIELWSAGWLGASDQAFFDQQKQKIAEAGLAGDFRYAGVVNREEKFDFLRQLDVMSVPTAYREPKGIYVLESLACGVPVVQPSHGAFPELVPETGGGVLVPPNDACALADALMDLITHPERRLALGRAGQAKVQSNFAESNMAQSTLQVFQKFLNVESKMG